MEQKTGQTRQHHHRGQWASKAGFILATAGAAIGLGNLWKFPYLMGRNGGFQFLAVYLIFIVVLGIPVMITEMSIGRMTQKNPVNACRTINKKITFIGVLGILCAFIIVSYYSVIGGWILKYIASYITTFQAPADFSAYIAQPVEPVVWLFVFMFLTAFVCYKGTKGIERASTVMMPGLFVLLIILIIRPVTLPGAFEGLRFIFLPGDGGFNANSLVAAMGQVFYSLSLGMGITITYGSYLRKEENIPKSCATIAGLDTMAAVMAGLAIFPAVFAFGLEPAQGQGLVFETLPRVFSELTGGAVFAILFFIMMFFAAITSVIALLESVASFFIDSLGWTRNKAVILTALAAFLLGIPSALSYGVLEDIHILGYSVFGFMEMITDNILMPIGGLSLCVYVGWFWGPGKIIAHIESSGSVKFTLKKAWIWCIRLITPVLIAVITVMGFINVYQYITA